MSRCLVEISPTAWPIPTPALFMSTSQRPKRSRCAATTRWTDASSIMFPATTSTSAPVPRSSRAAASSLSGRRAATVRPRPSSPSIFATARPMPLEAPVMIAARSAMGGIQAGGAYDRRVGKGKRVIGAVAAAGVAIGAAGCGGKAQRPPDLVAKVPLIAHRVERIRGETFKHVPRPRVVSPKQAEKEGLASLDRSYPARSRHADEEVLKLLGLLPRNADLRKLSGAVFGEQVAGYYDPRTKRLTVVRGARGFAGEVVLAHELTHALEDQRFKLTEGT